MVGPVGDAAGQWDGTVINVVCLSISQFFSETPKFVGTTCVKEGMV